MSRNAQLRFAARSFVEKLLDRVEKAVQADDLEGLDTSVKDDITAFLKAAEGDEPSSPVLKVDDDQRMVWGWASVAVENGTPVVDTQGDVIEMDMLQKAAHSFMLDYREAAAMHQQREIGTVVESIVFTKALQDALGVDFGREGWFVGVKIESDKVWKKVKSGEFRAFSIGGSGVREDI